MSTKMTTKIIPSDCLRSLGRVFLSRHMAYMIQRTMMSAARATALGTTAAAWESAPSRVLHEPGAHTRHL
jgi:hypothetical protein